MDSNNIIGLKFNQLTVIEETNERTSSRGKIYLCQCDCGTLKKVAMTKLKNGTKSCGCLKAKNIVPKFGKDHRHWDGYEDISKSFFSRIKASAEQRNHKFELTIEDLWDIYLSQDKKCALTGSVLEMPIHIRDLRNKSDQRLASLDRIDNELGYIKGNVRWICKRLNYMKHVLSEEEFLGWVKEIYEFKFKNEIRKSDQST